MNPIPRRRRHKLGNVYYGWWIVLASSAQNFFASGIFFRGFSVFFVPVRDSLGLTNSQTSLVFSLSRATAVTGPLIGIMIDRLGAPKLVFVGALIATVGYFAFSQVENFLSFALVYILLIGVGNTIAFQNASFTSLNMWFVRRRALVIALFSGTASLGSVVLIPVSNLLIIDQGWEKAALLAGFVYLFFVLPITLVFRDSPESIGLVPDGGRLPAGRPAPRGSPALVQGPDHDRWGSSDDFTVGEALRSTTFWLLLVGIGLHQLATVAIFINLQPILVWKGVGLETLGYLLSFAMAMSVVFRLALGLLADRWSKSRILPLSTGAFGIGLLLLLVGSWSDVRWAIFLFLLFGAVGDALPVIAWATLIDYFGRRRLGTLRGIILASSSWAIIVSPWFVGWWADRTGCTGVGEVVGEGCSYNLPIVLGALIFGLATLCFVFIRRPKRMKAVERPTQNT